MALGTVLRPHYNNMGQWQGALPTLSSDSQPWRACPFLSVSAASTTPAVSLHPQGSWLLRPTTASGVPRVREATVSSPVSTTVPRSWVLAAVWMRNHARVEGTQTCLGTKVQALQRLLPEEDILNSSEWLLPQICAARSAMLGSGNGSCSAGRAGATYS